jgi:hypothetical protein
MELNICVKSPGVEATGGGGGAGGEICVSGFCAALLRVCSNCVKSPGFGAAGGASVKDVFSTRIWVNTFARSPADLGSGVSPVTCGLAGDGWAGVVWNVAVIPAGLLEAAGTGGAAWLWSASNTSVNRPDPVDDGTGEACGAAVGQPCVRDWGAVGGVAGDDCAGVVWNVAVIPAGLLEGAVVGGAAWFAWFWSAWNISVNRPEPVDGDDACETGGGEGVQLGVCGSGADAGGIGSAGLPAGAWLPSRDFSKSSSWDGADFWETVPKILVALDESPAAGSFLPGKSGSSKGDLDGSINSHRITELSLDSGDLDYIAITWQ